MTAAAEPHFILPVNLNMAKNESQNYFIEFLGLFLSDPHAALTAFFVVDMVFIRWIMKFFDIVILSRLGLGNNQWAQIVPPSLIASLLIFGGFFAYVMRLQNRVRLELVDWESIVRIKAEWFDGNQLLAEGASLLLCYRRRIWKNNGIPIPFYAFPLPGEFSFSSCLPFVADFPIPKDLSAESPQAETDVKPTYSIHASLKIQGEFFRIKKRVTLSRTRA